MRRRRAVAGPAALRRGAWRVVAALAASGCLPGCADGGAAPAAAPGPLHFRDVTAASGIHLVTTSGRTPSTQILEVKGGGLALIDWDDDGDFDLFVPNGATLDRPEEGPGCRLYENEGGLRFADTTAASGVDFRRWGFGPAVGDADGDGRDDLFVSCFGRDALLHNEGGGRFRDVTEAAGASDSQWSTAACFVDLEGDGDLDLYVANYLEFDPAHPPAPTRFLGVEVFAGPAGLPAAPDSVWRNDGTGVFADVSEALGFRAVQPRHGLGVVALDFDADGRQEILVGNDSGPNFLFRRGDDGAFTDVATPNGLATNADGREQATMGLAIADVDGNGLPDVFSTNFQNDTNTLHLNLGDLLFEDRTLEWGLGALSRPFVGWATGFADFDLDQDEDLVVLNGHVYPREVTEPHGWGHEQAPLLLERSGSRFARVAPGAGGEWLAAPRCNRSAVLADLDRDGDLDLITGELNGKVRVLENDGARGNWLVVALEDARPGVANRRGYGARVELVGGGGRQRRWIHAGGSYQAAQPPEACFGLADDVTRVELEVTWPDGQRQSVTGAATRQRLVVERR